MSVATLGPADALRGIVPRERLLEGADTEKWCAGGGAPGAVVFPASSEEVASSASQPTWIRVEESVLPTRHG